MRDDQTLAARFWIDRATGLLLQRQLFSSDGFFEIAEVNGNAARRLIMQPGSDVELEFD